MSSNCNVSVTNLQPEPVAKNSTSRFLKEKLKQKSIVTSLPAEKFWVKCTFAIGVISIKLVSFLEMKTNFSSFGISPKSYDSHVALYFGLEFPKVDNTCNFIFSHNHAFKLTTHNPVKRSSPMRTSYLISTCTNLSL